MSTCTLSRVPTCTRYSTYISGDARVHTYASVPIGLERHSNWETREEKKSRKTKRPVGSVGSVGQVSRSGRCDAVNRHTAGDDDLGPVGIGRWCIISCSHIYGSQAFFSDKYPPPSLPEGVAWLDHRLAVASFVFLHVVRPPALTTTTNNTIAHCPTAHTTQHYPRLSGKTITSACLLSPWIDHYTPTTFISTTTTNYPLLHHGCQHPVNRPASRHLADPPAE